MAPVKPSRALPPFLALLLLAGTGAAWGQDVPEDAPAQDVPSELTPPPLVPAPAPGTSDTPSRKKPPPEDEGPRPQAPQDEPATSVSEPARPGRATVPPEDPVPRVAVEVVGGIAGGVVAGTVGVAAGYLLAAPTVGCDECRVVAFVGGFTGVLLGIPAGTWLGGNVMGGKGRFLYTAGGSLVGWGGALLGSLLLGASSEDDAVALALLVLPIVGATTGYELSYADERKAPAPRAEGLRVQVVPLAGMTERGPRLGLMGRF